LKGGKKRCGKRKRVYGRTSKKVENIGKIGAEKLPREKDRPKKTDA